MKNINNTTYVSDFTRTLSKSKKLKSDTIYPYSALGENGDKLRVYISRLADRGVIVKTERGLFYKPSAKTVVKRSMKEIPLDKSLFTNDLFWNVKDGFKIETDLLISAYLKNYTQDELMGLYSLFGYSRLIEESLKIYKSRRDINYQKIREILMTFETWRMSDDK